MTESKFSEASGELSISEGDMLRLVDAIKNGGTVQDFIEANPEISEKDVLSMLQAMTPETDGLGFGEKEDLQLALLDATYFREVLAEYYRTGVMLTWYHWLEMPVQNLPWVQVKAGDHKFNLQEIRDSFVGPKSIPDNVRKHLMQISTVAIKESYQMSFFRLLEESRDGEDAPPSIKQVITELEKPENKELVNRLSGNAEANIKSIKQQAKHLWNQHGKSAYIFRNPLIHGRALMTDPDSKVWKETVENEESSRDFYATLDGIYSILEYISKTCFAAENSLPKYNEFWESLFNDKPFGSEVWCFDGVKYPFKLLGSQFPKRVLPAN